MALAAITKAEMRQRAYDMYGEDSASNKFLTATFVNTCVQEAAEEFAFLSGCVLGSARRARPSNSAGEALLLLPTGMYSVDRVTYIFTIGTGATAGTTYTAEIPQTTDTLLRFTYWTDPEHGAGWVLAPDTGDVWRGMWFHKWYDRSPRYIGFFPPSIIGGSAVGTAIVWGRVAPDVMTTGSSSCEIPPEYVPGVIALACARMARRDADADERQERSKDFTARAQPYIATAARASRYSRWAKED